MEVQQLRHLLAAVQYGNLVKAAEVSHISQSGLSRSIKSLENRLGVQLLIRSSNGVEPTVYGMSLLDRARLILNEVQRSVQEVKEIKAGRGGSVSLGVTHNFAHNLIPDVLTAMGSGPKTPAVQVTAGAFPVIVDLVKTGQIDVGFGLLAPLEMQAGLSIEVVGGCHNRVVARPDHPLAGMNRVTPAQLAAADWSLLDSASLLSKVSAFFHARGETMPGQPLRTNSVVLLKAMIMRRDLLTVLPVDMVRTELEDGRLVAIDAEPPSEFARAGLVLREDTYVSPAMQRLIAEIRKRCSDAADDVFRYPSDAMAAAA